MSPAPSHSRRPMLTALLLAALAALTLWFLASRPVAVAGAIEGRLSSLSFSPYRAGQSPLIRVYPSEAELADDLARVAQVARGVRTYTSLEGFDRVPPLAARHGLTATMGAWLTTDPQHNRRELEALIRVANDHPQTVSRIIVGNETLVRHEVTPAELIALLREARARVRQPVSYADVPVVWHHHPELAAEVDFITVHVLPYWEDQAVPYAATREYLLETVRKIRERFPGKPILIGESGWPADGRPRGPALPGRAEQAGYLRMLAQVAAEQGFDYNVIEAFDQPWKGALEGLVGAHWGVFTFDREAKYPPAGPIEPLPGWERQAALAVGGGLLAAGAVLTAGVRFGPALLFAAALQGLAALLVLGLGRTLGSAFTPHDTLRAALVSAVLIALAALTVWRSGGWLAGRPAGDRLGGPLLLAAIALALAHAWQLTFHGHLLDFPVGEVAVPAACVALLAAARRLAGAPWPAALAAHALFGPALTAPPPPAWFRWLARLLTGVLLAAAVGVLVAEAYEAVRDDFGRDQPLAGRIRTAIAWFGATGAANLWSALLAGLALPFALSGRGRPVAQASRAGAGSS